MDDILDPNVPSPTLLTRPSKTEEGEFLLNDDEFDDDLDDILLKGEEND